MMRKTVSAGVALLAAVIFTAPATAQEVTLPQQVISANPFGLLLEIFNAEYERVVTPSSTAGVGGSTIGIDDSRYLNADVFWRFYPGGEPLDGWAFGVKVGVTSVSDDGVNPVGGEGAYLGYGFDANRSWLLGESNNFYVGVGFGLKRLVGVDEEDSVDAPAMIPTLRIVNIGYAF